MSSSSSSTLPQIKRRHGQNESIHRIKRIIYTQGRPNQPTVFLLFLSQLSFFFCADDKTDDFSSNKDAF